MFHNITSQEKCNGFKGIKMNDNFCTSTYVLREVGSMNETVLLCKQDEAFNSTHVHCNHKYIHKCNSTITMNQIPADGTIGYSILHLSEAKMNSCYIKINSLAKKKYIPKLQKTDILANKMKLDGVSINSSVECTNDYCNATLNVTMLGSNVIIIIPWKISESIESSQETTSQKGNFVSTMQTSSTSHSDGTINYSNTTISTKLAGATSKKAQTTAVPNSMTSQKNKNPSKDCEPGKCGNFTFNHKTKHGFRISSEESCDDGTPKAVAHCRHASLHCENNFENICELDLNTVINTNVTTENVDTTFELLAIKTIKNKNLKQESKNIAKVIGQTINILKKGQVNITLETARNVLDVSAEICKSISNDQDTEYDKARSLLLQNLPDLPTLFQDENEIFNEEYAMKSLTLHGKRDAKYEPLVFEEHVPSPPISIQINSSAFKLGSSASFVYDRHGCLNPSNKNADETASISVTGEIIGPPGSSMIGSITFRNIADKIKSVRNEAKFKWNLTCAFFNDTTKQWENTGIFQTTDNQAILCETTHFTNFALLMIPSHVDVPFSFVLDIFGKLALSLSIICLVITIVFNLRNEKVRSQRSNIMKVNICINLMLVYVTFLGGITSTWNTGLCTATAIFLQFFMLSTWFWMVVYSYDLHFCLVVVFDRHESHFMKKASALAYGIPFIIVIITTALGLSLNNRNAENVFISKNVCWLQGYFLYIGALVPMAIFLLFNITMYIIIMKNIVWGSNEVQANGKNRSTKEGVVLGCTFAATTGLTWVLGYLMLVSHNGDYLIVMSWLFTLATGSQGILIFILTCARHKSFKKAILQPMWRLVTCPLQRTGFMKVQGETTSGQVMSTSFSSDANRYKTSGTEATEL